MALGISSSQAAYFGLVSTGAIGKIEIVPTAHGEKKDESWFTSIVGHPYWVYVCTGACAGMAGMTMMFSKNYVTSIRVDPAKLAMREKCISVRTHSLFGGRGPSVSYRPGELTSTTIKDVDAWKAAQFWPLRASGRKWSYIVEKSPEAFVECTSSDVLALLRGRKNRFAAEYAEALKPAKTAAEAAPVPKSRVKTDFWKNKKASKRERRRKR